ncbi:hypothetical protein F0L68_16195 [Solihabitans fulvus]|uniref:Uncharacterized protein n=2 Tax=Solihabitans fulvus TaxID=1892852 RepID=A0A5B2XEW1_9PSEU|nr:hypothetical protein F0L68_16195 [Solihabitans fulvus]
MLVGCAEALVAEGWRVVLPSRRQAVLSAEVTAQPAGLGIAARQSMRPPGHLPTAVEDGPRTPQVRWVSADWSEPELLASATEDALDGPADLLVAWVHPTYRAAVLRAVAPLLAPHAPVVEVHGSESADPVRGLPDPVLSTHPTQLVVLGCVRHSGTTRWLSHAEISTAVREAVHRALDGRAPSAHVVGEPA